MITFNEINTHPNYQHGQYGWKYLVDLVESGKLNTQPHYQRGRVWTTAQKEAYIGAAIEEVVFTPFYFRQWSGVEDRMEVVDGQQRISAIVDFWQGKVDGVNPVTGKRFNFNDLDDDAVKTIGKAIRIPVFIMEDVTDEAVYATYLRVNTGGTPHTPEELDRVRNLLRDAQGK